MPVIYGLLSWAKFAGYEAHNNQNINYKYSNDYGTIIVLLLPTDPLFTRSHGRRIVIVVFVVAVVLAETRHFSFSPLCSPATTTAQHNVQANKKDSRNHVIRRRAQFLGNYKQK